MLLVTAGIRTSTRKCPASSWRTHGVVDAALRGQPLAQQLEAESDAARARAIGIAGIVERDRQRLAVACRRQPDGAALDELADAVHDGVLDERLQQQRRHEAVDGGGIGLAGDLQT